MTETTAWLLQCNESLRIAVAEYEIVEYVQHPIMRPATVNNHVSSEVDVRGASIPVIDLPHLMELSSPQESPAICIVAYQLIAGGELKQLALSTQNSPVKIMINDSQACEPPKDLKGNRLEQYIISCFEDDAGPVLIFDFASFSSGELA